MKNKLLSILLFTLITTRVSATVDYLVVNHTTKQLYWAETGHPPGWIGWETIPGGAYESEREKYLEMGYSFTENPFMIEWAIALTIVLSLLAYWIVRKLKTRYNQATPEK